MLIFPAIDLKDGQVVRLVKGDFSSVHQVARDPVSTAEQFYAAGARQLHMVDLDGARDIQVHHLAEALQYRPPGHLRA